MIIIAVILILIALFIGSIFFEKGRKEQAAQRRARTTPAEPDTPDVSLGDIAQRLARIEELLASPSTPPE